MINLNEVNKMPGKVKSYYLVKILVLFLFFSSLFCLINKDLFIGVFVLLFIFIGLPIYVSLLIEYANYKFIVEEGKITINSGLLNKHSKTIPFDRIQNVENVRGIIAQLFGLATIKIWTSSASQIQIRKGESENKPESAFILATADAEWLKNFISKKDVPGKSL